MRTFWSWRSCSDPNPQWGRGGHDGCDVPVPFPGCGRAELDLTKPAERRVLGFAAAIFADPPTPSTAPGFSAASTRTGRRRGRHLPPPRRRRLQPPQPARQQAQLPTAARLVEESTLMATRSVWTVEQIRALG